MSVIRAIQSAFTAGELSPLLHQQQEAPLYQYGLKRCRNMVSLSQGAVVSRPGTQFLGEVTDVQVPVTNARCVPIEIDARTWAVAVLGGGGLRLLTGGSFETDKQFVTNPEMNEGLTGWEGQTAGPISGIEAVSANGTNAINMYAAGDNPPGAGGTVRLRQSLTIDEVGTQDIVIEFGMWWATGRTQAASNIRVRIGTTIPGSSDVLDQVYNNPPGGSEYISFSVPASTGYTGPLHIEVWGDGFQGQFIDLNWEYCRVWVNGIVGDPSPTLNTPYADEDLDDIQFVSSPFEVQTVFTHPDYPPQELILDGANWQFREIVFDNDPGDDPEWGPLLGYPAACGAYQGRLVLGGSPNEPQTVWATSPGDWRIIGQVQAPTAADPVWFTLSVRGAIRWIHGQKALMIGASTGEWQVVAVGTGILQAGDIQANLQSGYGSASIQAAPVGEYIFFVGGDKLTVRGTNYSRDMQGWAAENMNWEAEHITRPGVRRIANARDPYQITWLPLQDGSMAAVSYEPTHEIHGWHKHTTGGEFVDSCNARVLDDDYTFFIVRRSVDSEQRFYLEAIREVKTREDAVHLDSWKRYHLGDPAGSVDGMEHLEGRLVGVIGDGVYQGVRTVTSGSVTVSPPASTVEVGLLFTATMETLPAPAPPNIGGLGGYKSWSEIGLRLESPAPPLVNGIRQVVEDGDTAMVELGWDKFGTIVVEQDRPEALVVTGLYGRLNNEDFIG